MTLPAPRPKQPLSPASVPPGHNVRSWWWDALAALALFGQAVVLGRLFGRLNILAGLFAVAVFGGLGWMFAKSAWRGLMDGRDAGRRRR